MGRVGFREVDVAVEIEHCTGTDQLERHRTRKMTLQAPTQGDIFTGGRNLDEGD